MLPIDINVSSVDLCPNLQKMAVVATEFLLTLMILYPHVLSVCIISRSTIYADVPDYTVAPQV